MAKCIFGLLPFRQSVSIHKVRFIKVLLVIALRTHAPNIDNTPPDNLSGDKSRLEMQIFHVTR